MAVTPKIAPSMLSSDFANLASEAHRMINYGADWLHMDIMVLPLSIYSYSQNSFLIKFQFLIFMKDLNCYCYYELLLISMIENVLFHNMVSDMSHFCSFSGWVRTHSLSWF